MADPFSNLLAKVQKAHQDSAQFVPPSSKLISRKQLNLSDITNLYARRYVETLVDFLFSIEPDNPHVSISFNLEISEGLWFFWVRNLNGLVRPQLFEQIVGLPSPIANWTPIADVGWQKGDLHITVTDPGDIITRDKQPMRIETRERSLSPVRRPSRQRSPLSMPEPVRRPSRRSLSPSPDHRRSASRHRASRMSERRSPERRSPERRYYSPERHDSAARKSPERNPSVLKSVGKTVGRILLGVPKEK